MNEISKILTNARILKGLTVLDLSNSTKIRKTIIENIEGGNFDDFQDVYLKAYIRNLAKELKLLDNPEFIEAYKSISKLTRSSSATNTDESEKPKRTVTASDINLDIQSSTNDIISSYNPKSKNTSLFKKQPKLSYNFIAYTLLFLFLGSILIYTFYPFTSSNDDIPELGISPTNNAEQDKQDEEGNNSLLNFFQSNDSLRLTAKAFDSVWVNILIDKSQKVQLVLVPNQNYVWSAKEEFLITHGNSGKIKLWLNDKELEQFAPNGYIAKNVLVTADKIVNPNNQRIDSLRKNRKKPKKEEENRIRLIEPSNINN